VVFLHKAHKNEDALKHAAGLVLVSFPLGVLFSVH
jgi:hypothetical protein